MKDTVEPFKISGKQTRSVVCKRDFRVDRAFVEEDSVGTGASSSSSVLVDPTTGQFDWSAMAKATVAKKSRPSTEHEENWLKWRQRGEQLAEEAGGSSEADDGKAKYVEAVNCFEKALAQSHQFSNDQQITAELNEMISQCYLEMDLPMEASRACQLAVSSNPRWAVARQTLGRCQMNLGELRLALRNFSAAIHLQPHDATEIRQQDLEPAFEILQRIINDRRQQTKDEETKEELTTHKVFSETSAVTPQGFSLIRLDK